MIKRVVIQIAKFLLPLSLRVKIRKSTHWLTWKKQAPIELREVTCPIIGKSYSHFIDTGGDLVNWENFSKSRHRSVYLYLRDFTSFLTTTNVLLHIAPEYSLFHSLKKNTWITYVPVDKKMPGYDYEKCTEDFDLLNNSMNKHSVDVILCNHVLEHIPNDAQAIAEMYRIVRPNGMVIITVPLNENALATYEDFRITSPKEREKHFGQWDHVRVYGKDIVDRFQSAGFHVMLFHVQDKYSKDDAIKYGITKGDLILVATKS